MAGVWKGEGFDPGEVLAELDAMPFIPLEEKVAGLSPVTGRNQVGGR